MRPHTAAPFLGLTLTLSARDPQTLTTFSSQKFAPIIDIFAVVVNKVQPNGPPEKPAEVPRDAKFQYQRAYYLSKELSDQLRTYSTEQINQIRAQSVIVQSASATAQSVTQLASSSYDAAQVRVHALSDTMLSELREVRVSWDPVFHCMHCFSPRRVGALSDVYLGAPGRAAVDVPGRVHAPGDDDQ